MARAIMIQGTMSNVGKSLLTAGLCRIFRQDGWKVAPFKSQNMALNSYITADGLEMGRAQVMQAQAAGVEPDVCMNPILLKPTDDVGSQVIVNGEVLGNYPAREYFAFKKKLIPVIREAYRRLDEDYDIIVIEGAGSPAEINLKQDDIVNMGLAKMVDAPVLLAGDIDRGGVFAQLVGTVSLLEEEERALVKGLIINKFRGDKTILDPGIEMLEKLAGIPVVGVVPYMHVQLDEEDSLSERLQTGAGGNMAGTGPDEMPAVDIAVIRLPKLSNYTDFYPFDMIDGVRLRYISSVRELGQPDMIVIPGTKSTMADLKWMRQNGLEAAIKKAAAAGTVVFGICGGFQMLGEAVSDPYHAESAGASDSIPGSMSEEAADSISDNVPAGISGIAADSMAGMGLLPVTTVFSPQKTRKQVQGVISRLEGALECLSGLTYEGYEIHMGRTDTGSSGNSREEVQSIPAGETVIGCGNVYGSYVHGIFDREEIAASVVRALASRKGLDLSAAGAVDMVSFRETQYDLLAQNLRENLDMQQIYSILGLTRKTRADDTAGN